MDMPYNPDTPETVARELLRKAEALQPILLERASAAEEARRLGDETIADLATAGFFGVSAPRRLGGACVSTADTARIAAALAKGCPSTAWIFSVSNSNSLTASLVPEPIQREVFAGAVPIVCGAVNPSGTSRRVPGGYVVNGSWPYSSGCYHAQWGAFALADRSPDGKLIGATIYLPMSEVSIEDTWHVAGLKATGSNTVVARELFVPEHRYMTWAGGAQPQPQPQEASDFLAIAPHFRTVLLSVLLGTAEAVLERVIARAKTHGIAFTTYTTQADSHAVQKEIGEISVIIQTGRMLMIEAAKAIDAAALSRQPMSYIDRTTNRAQTCFATDLLVDAVGRLMYIAGSSAFAESNHVQRFWRDINVAARHAISIPRVGYEIHGRALLGVEPNVSPSHDLI
jgi:alkylation response protein AidB-like acyl-CoA dehydrogenase